MKNITSSFNGLTSSLLNSIGLTEIAQKLDPVSNFPVDLNAEAHGPALSVPTNFTPKPRA